MHILLSAAALMLLGCTVQAQTAEPTEKARPYPEQITEWRKERETKLKGDSGWLRVAGLYWLKEGKNTLGTATSNAIVLPAGSTAASAGKITLDKGKVTLDVAEGVTARIKENPVTSQELKSDKTGTPDRVIIGALTLTVIERGKRIGIRLYDNNAKTLTEFAGLKWYPVNPAYRVTAKFIAYDPPKSVPITNVLGDTEPVPVPGYLLFTLNGKEVRLDAQSEGDGLFLNFRDLTSGKTTYPAGRFLDAPKPENGEVILDFNQAYSPPCSLTAFATCPLPPRQNYLTVSIPAGEKFNRKDHR